jgi:tRNA dimethylallyltransferase
MFPHIAIVYGPTASGKSALALALAAKIPLVIINGDAMQMYRELRIITARPSTEDESRAPHALYGCIDSSTASHAALWLEMATREIHAAWQQNKLPVVVGGTGMYLTCLMQGISAVPPIPEAIRSRVRALGKGAWETLHAHDPVMAARLKPGDTQRILRALEVVEATGISLAVWQAQKSLPPLPEATFHPFVILPERAALYAKINARFDAMMENGALEEVRPLLNAPPATHHSPLFKAHGVPELLAHLRGEMALYAAISKAQQNTRNYAKRQLTWARHQLPEAKNADSVFDLAAQLV